MCQLSRVEATQEGRLTCSFVLMCFHVSFVPLMFGIELNIYKVMWVLWVPLYFPILS